MSAQNIWRRRHKYISNIYISGAAHMRCDKYIQIYLLIFNEGRK